MSPIVSRKSSTGIPLSAWTFLKTCSAKRGLSCDAGCAKTSPAPISRAVTIPATVNIRALVQSPLNVICVFTSLPEVNCNLTSPAQTLHSSSLCSIQSHRAALWRRHSCLPPRHSCRGQATGETPVGVETSLDAARRRCARHENRRGRGYAHLGH